VAHIGFVDDGLLRARITRSEWLHARLEEVTTGIVGLDIANEGVAWAVAQGYEAYVCDVQDPTAVKSLKLAPFELVVAGEVIEHLDSPGPFLRAMHDLVAPNGVLAVTTPNAFRALNFFTPLRHYEFVHPDHTAWYSPRTLSTICSRAGWLPEIQYYNNPPSSAVWTCGAHATAAAAVRRLASGVARWTPYWSDGLIAWCRRA
jgi:SAM-dependent methyltransferase